MNPYAHFLDSQDAMPIVETTAGHDLNHLGQLA